MSAVSFLVYLPSFFLVCPPSRPSHDPDHLSCRSHLVSLATPPSVSHKTSVGFTKDQLLFHLRTTTWFTCEPSSSSPADPVSVSLGPRFGFTNEPPSVSLKTSFGSTCEPPSVSSKTSVGFTKDQLLFYLRTPTCFTCEPSPSSPVDPVSVSLGPRFGFTCEPCMFSSFWG
jgi:hypothetical protein